MTQRFELIDLFASEALAPLIVRCDGSTVGREGEIARRAYALAGAMIDERRALQADYNRPDRVKARNLRAKVRQKLQQCGNRVAHNAYVAA